MRIAPSLLVATFFVAATSLTVRDGSACAAAYSRELREPIEIKREEALIVFDAATKVEHFIRRAVFDTKVKSFGFLVPTPSRPTLAEAPVALFDALKDLTKPEVKDAVDWNVIPGCAALLLDRSKKSAALASAAAVDDARAVRVLEEARVAGMDATILSASDTAPLAAWLKDRGFDMRPALTDWLEPYVKKGYVITAFRYERPDVAANGVLGPGIAPSAVRLTFATDRAFYPYREPADAPNVFGRALHVFTITNTRTAGALSSFGGADEAWSGSEVRYADAFASGGAIASLLAGVPLPQGAWLTETRDWSSKRAAKELFFANEKNVAVRPPPIIRTLQHRTLFLPIEPLLFGGLGFWFWRRRRSRARAR